MSSNVLSNYNASSTDTLKVVHRTSEPFDHPIDPASLDTISFTVGQIVAVNASGYAEVADAANVATTKIVGLFLLPSTPTDARKNNYVLASGNASIFSSGIVMLSTQISNAAVSAADKLYVGDDGQITTASTSGVVIGSALSSRTEATAEIKVKLEL